MTSSQTSVEIFLEFRDLARRMATFVGADVIAENYRPNYRSWMSLTATTTYMVTIPYTIWYYYPDYIFILQSLAIIGIGVQGFFKFYSALVHRKFFQGRIKYLEDFHRQQTNHPWNRIILRDLMRNSFLVGKFLIATYLSAAFGFALYPIYIYVVYGERVLPLTALLPGINADSHTGYFLTLGFQLFVLGLGLSGMSAADLAILLFVVNLAALVDVFKGSLQELNVLLEAPIRDEQAIRKKTRDIFLEHGSIENYESELDERYFFINFIQIVSAVSCMSISLFLCYTTNYLPGYAFLVGAFFQLLEFCLLGTIFTVKNNHMIDAIYDVKWYLLPLKERREWNFLLHKSQNAIDLTVGGFSKLNLETFVAIINTIYQYFAILINFVEN
ncbi:putative odorant receptor 83c [Uranotaenia lowii]|uniref:putative odorant receptor 83c n=1 Tax=Uranotaenia lowii TaxID=190385 RepID=UPI002478A51E|nr:putative odorant receptor 83c [Uranotaenia lowii]